LKKDVDLCNGLRQIDLTKANHAEEKSKPKKS